MADSRGFALLQEDAGQAKFETGFQHLHGRWFQLQRDVKLGRRHAGELLHVDVSGRQHLGTALRLLQATARTE